jgi:multidrug efflux pump subunit AcrB
MRLVLAALGRPVTVVVTLVALALFAFLASKRMPMDIFPKVDENAIYVAQPFGGMDPAQMEGYLTYYYEYHFLYITGINRVESKSIQGASLMKLIFHGGTDMQHGDRTGRDESRRGAGSRYVCDRQMASAARAAFAIRTDDERGYDN